MGLRSKMNLVLAAACLPALLLILFGVQHAASRVASEAASREASLLTAEATVAADYATNEVAPLVSPGGHEPLIFVPAAAPFFGVHEQARLLNKQMPEVQLRRVVLDPVDDADRPDAWERATIMRLRGEKDPQPFTIERADANGRHLLLVTPLPFSRGICATCYVSRADAPPGIQDAFGGNAGFDRHPGEIVGITVASVPIASTGGVVWTAMVLTLVALAVLVAAMNVALQVLVLRPLNHMAAVAERVSLGQPEVAEFDHAGSDEIGIILRAFNRLRRSMETAIALVDP